MEMDSVVQSRAKLFSPEEDLPESVYTFPAVVSALSCCVLYVKHRNYGNYGLIACCQIHNIRKG